MANRVLLGDIGSNDFGLKISRPGVDVTSATDKQLLFDSRKGRTGQIYAGASGLNFVNTVSDQEAEVIGTANLYGVVLSNNGSHVGKKIIINGTTVTISRTTTSFGVTWTTAQDIVDDINNTSIATGTVTAFVRTIGTTQNLRLRDTSGDLVISYPATNSLESVVGIGAQTIEYPDLAANGVNFLTATGSTKPNLGYVPLLILSEKVAGGYEGEVQDENFETINRLSIWKTTSSHMYPIGGAATFYSASSDSADNNGTVSGAPVFIGREYDYNDSWDVGPVDTNMTNASFLVLRIPCAYGYMTSTYFG